jgi:hypothetical protein
MRLARKRIVTRWVVPLWLLPLILTTAGLAACSSRAEEPPLPASQPPSPAPSRLDPVISRVEGEADNIARYENTLVGLRIRFNAATYSIYDDPAELPAEMRWAGSEATVQFKGIMRNGSMWITVIPTPMNHSPEEIADAYREAGVEMARLLAASSGYGGELDLGPARVVRQDTIGGLPATVMERRGTEALTDMPIRIRSTVVVGTRYTYLILMQVVANGFGEEFRRLDEVLDGVSISDGDAA